MSSPLGPSVDEVLLIEEKQYASHRLKPIGAERKIGRIPSGSIQCQPTSFPLKHTSPSSERLLLPMDRTCERSDAFDADRYFNSFEMFSTPMASGQSDSSSYPQFYSQSSSSASSSSDHSPRSSSHLLEYYQTQQQFNSIATSRAQTAPIAWRTNTSMRPSPHLSQTYPRVPFLAGYQSTRSFLSVTAVPVFTAPFHSSRERFQVNSMGRPIVRPQNHHHPCQLRGYPNRR